MEIVLSTGTIDPANLTLRVPRELVSPNKWNGRHWRVKHQISQDWEQDITWSVAAHGRGLVAAIEAIRGPGKSVGYVPGRIRVTIAREVPSYRNFIRDDDNLRFCVKPLLDALKRQGYIRNDSRKWIELPTPEQRLSADKQHWTVIQLEGIS